MQKKKVVLLSLASLLGLFFLLTGINTFTIKSKQPAPNPSTETIDEDLAVSRLSEAITYRTISYQDRSKFDFKEFEKFISFLQKNYPAVHEQLELERLMTMPLFINGKALIPAKSQ
ncbi:hypothetical protein [Neobacillus notoginsengisoli]|uniref:hypothetical protein n=1 Tax=Neobacillus notoginsengisoli TaxID=1578198 RepID=UPI00131462F5|nr:hypothetical protein [Neobacillus notoginsengisoli]